MKIKEIQRKAGKYILPHWKDMYLEVIVDDEERKIKLALRETQENHGLKHKIKNIYGFIFGKFVERKD